MLLKGQYPPTSETGPGLLKVSKINTSETLHHRDTRHSSSYRGSLPPPEARGERLIYRLRMILWPSPALPASSQTPPLWHGRSSHPPALPQHWYTPNTRLRPVAPGHSAASPALIGSPLNSRASRQPAKPPGRGRSPGAPEAPKSRAPCGRIIRHGSASGTEAGRRRSRVSRRALPLTSSRTACHRPSDTGSDVTSSEPGAAAPQPNRKCSSPSVSWGEKTRVRYREEEEKLLRGRSRDSSDRVHVSSERVSQGY